MEMDLERVKRDVQRAPTEDLLDRVTVYRTGMESDALAIIEEELRTRAVSPAEVQAHAERRRVEVRFLPDGTAARCSFCDRPAIALGWGWHRLWGLVPVFPRFFYYCNRHRPSSDVTPEGAPRPPE